jgi:hypothetical protein
MLRKYLKVLLWVCAIMWIVVTLLVHMRLTFYSASSSGQDEYANSCRAVAAIAAALPHQYRSENVDVSKGVVSSTVPAAQLKSNLRRRELPVLPRVVVYRPFVSRDVNTLLLNMKAWSNSALSPCASSQLLPTAGNVDLVFWSASPQTEVESLRRLVQHAPWRSCFGDVKFHSFSKQQKLVETGYNNPSIVFQFLSIFRDFRAQGYNYVFQMEPDVLPIRRGWVDRLLHICSAASAGINDFWMMASLTVKDEFDTGTGQMQPEDFLPNGNGIWNVGNRHFAALVDAWIGDVFLGTNFNYTDPKNGFDRAIHESRLRDNIVVDAEGVQLWGNGSSRHYFHKFAFTDFVVNYGSFRLYSQTALKNTQPNAFLAHSKWPVDSLPEILSQIIHRKLGHGLAASIIDYTLLQG